MTGPARPFSPQLATVFGGSGFLGRYVVNALAKRNWRIRVAVRRPHIAGYLQTYGMVGQVHTVQANIRHASSIAEAVKGAGAVINLVGILQPRGQQTFAAVQADGARHVAEAAAAVGARVIHVSAIGADGESESLYARSKAEGERNVLAFRPDAVVLRPSIMFGPGDSFFNRFAALASVLPVIPLAGADTRFQPVFAGEVARAIARAADGTVAGGRIYELGGPEVKSFKELMQFVLATTGRQRLLLPVPFALAKFQASFLQLMPKPLLTTDQVELLRRDAVVSDEAKREERTLEALGIDPIAMATIVPLYLWRFRKTGQFQGTVVSDQ